MAGSVNWGSSDNREHGLGGNDRRGGASTTAGCSRKEKKR